ncbi:MAG: tetratricopeptide repeat protein [Bacteroidaceae bacterium]|nr:tetratricopeptide repeat protein [Bacteroidaceae bacterium]
MWHSFTARYNTFYNGNEAYKKGMIAKETGHKDNYTEFLPVFMVSSEISRQLGSGDFERSIEKCKKAIQLHSISRRPKLNGNGKRTEKEKAYLAQKEFNPLLDRVWMLMGEAYFQRGRFLEAASMFSYITRHYATQPEIVNEARAYLIRCYTELEWFYDAEETIGRMQRDTITRKVRKIVDASMANLLMQQGKYAEALPYLEKVASKVPSSLRKARLHFLVGQLHQHLGNNEASYEAYQRCLSNHPPHILAFNARIRQTEVVAQGKKTEKMLKRLKRMASDSKNKEYLDQVYYAMGNIHMTNADTAKAIAAYEAGRADSQRNGIEKGVLVLRLAELYWTKADYTNAQSCYNEALGLIGKEHEQYEEVKHRSKVLDELVPHTEVIHLQDSLLALSTMSEADRNAAIDRVIEELKRKEKEAEKLAADSAAQERMQQGSGLSPSEQQKKPTTQSSADKSWYFYNTTAVTQGKENFKKLWGNRKLEDDWRRTNRTVIAFEDETAQADSLVNDSLQTDSLVAADEEAQELAPTQDPHKREFYLEQIPFTAGQKMVAHGLIEEALFEAAVIEKDKLEDFNLAERTFNRLMKDYPESKAMPDVYYHLFLMYSRWGQTAQANHFRQLMAQKYPNDERTGIITAPNYEYQARYAIQIEDSLYQATYNAYRERNNAQVQSNAKLSAEQYPKGLNRPKFIFVDILSRIAETPADTLIKELKALVTMYPKSDVSTLAGMMARGLEEGRLVGTGALDVGSLWDMRTAKADLAAEEVAEAKQFETEINTPFCFLIAYPTDTINDNQLLYDIAHFNFTSYMSRVFDIQCQRGKAITQFIVGGFNNFEEAHRYAQRMSLLPDLSNKLSKARTFIISKQNIMLIGSAFSYEDYAKFYEHHFAPQAIDIEHQKQDIDDEPLQRYEDELSPEELQDLENKDSKEEYEGETSGESEGDWY